MAACESYAFPPWLGTLLSAHFNDLRCFWDENVCLLALCASFTFAHRKTRTWHKGEDEGVQPKKLLVRVAAISSLDFTR